MSKPILITNEEYAVFKLIDERDGSERSITLDCSIEKLEEFLDDPEFEDFLWSMESGKEEWSGVHDFVGEALWIGYTSYEIKNHDAAIGKWKEFFHKHGLYGKKD